MAESVPLNSQLNSHRPVFLKEVLDCFSLVAHPVRSALDGTFGRGGHTRAILEKFEGAQMVALDRDADALRFGEQSFAQELGDKKIHFVHANFTDIADVKKDLAASGFPTSFDVMLLDLGVSSPQLDQADRGFSFYHDGPLDMRMDHRSSLTAADIINTFPEEELAKLFIEYGEVQRPFRVVRAIVNDRKTRKPFDRTSELAGLIERVDGWQKKGSHPATRYFMALRLKVNDELEGLEAALPELIKSLNPGGILAVITFHSLEDRIVKQTFKANLELGRLINKKVIKPSDEETKINPRARSAKLRAFERGS